MSRAAVSKTRSFSLAFGLLFELSKASNKGVAMGKIRKRSKEKLVSDVTSKPVVVWVFRQRCDRCLIVCCPRECVVGEGSIAHHEGVVPDFMTGLFHIQARHANDFGWVL